MRRTWAVATAVMLLGVLPTAALAQEEDAPTVTLSQDVDLLIGQEIEVSVEGFPGG